MIIGLTRQSSTQRQDRMEELEEKTKTKDFFFFLLFPFPFKENKWYFFRFKRCEWGAFVCVKRLTSLQAAKVSIQSGIYYYYYYYLNQRGLTVCIRLVIDTNVKIKIKEDFVCHVDILTSI
ncbi:hypothetical protein Hanom_Chr06g00579461 [Helianthus anomalus]